MSALLFCIDLFIVFRKIQGFPLVDFRSLLHGNFLNALFDKTKFQTKNT